MVSDALHRPAIVHGVHILDLKFLSGLAERALPENMAAGAPFSTSVNGIGNRTDHYQYARCSGSAGRQTDGLCANAEVSSGVQERQNRRQQISQTARLGSGAP